MSPTLTFAVLCSFGAVCMGVSCPNGWVPGPVNNCYKFVMNPKATWQAAQGLCRDMGGEMAVLDSLMEIYWLRGYRSYHSAVREESWVGGFRKDNRWYWSGRIADSTITVTDWAPAEPNNSFGKEDCLNLNDGTGSSPEYYYSWNDAPCAWTRSFICERPLK